MSQIFSLRQNDRPLLVSHPFLSAFEKSLSATSGNQGTREVLFSAVDIAMELDEKKEQLLTVGAAFLGLCATYLSHRKKRKAEKSYLRRRDVPMPEDSAMATMLKSGDETYLFLFRMRKHDFERLLVVFEPIWWTKNLRILRNVMRRRQKRLLTCKLALALVVRYLVTTTEGTDAASHFGLLQASYSYYLRHGLRCLREALKLIPETNYCVPTLRQLERYADAITELSDGKLKNVWGAVDGICLHFESSSDMFIEGDHYSGFKKRPTKKLVCCFGPDGSICGATWARGTMPDSDLFRPISLKLELQHRRANRCDRLRVLGDAAFPHSRVCFQATERNTPDRDVLRVIRQIRNYSEIGLGSLVKGCRRLNVKLPSDDAAMVNIIIETTLLLTNYRIRVARFGQLLSMHWDVLGDDESECGDESDGDESDGDESDGDESEGEEGGGQ